MPSTARFTMIMVTIMFGGVGLLFLVAGIMVIQSSGGSADGILLACVGGISALIGWTPLMLKLRKGWIKRSVISQGTIVQSDYLDIVRAEYAVNNWQPYLVRSQWHDVQQNKLYIFKSGPITHNPARFLKKGLKIPVYINPKNPKQYYMDIEAAPGLSGIHLQ